MRRAKPPSRPLARTLPRTIGSGTPCGEKRWLWGKIQRSSQPPRHAAVAGEAASPALQARANSPRESGQGNPTPVESPDPARVIGCMRMGAYAAGAVHRSRLILAREGWKSRLPPRAAPLLAIHGMVNGVPGWPVQVATHQRRGAVASQASPEGRIARRQGVVDVADAFAVATGRPGFLPHHFVPATSHRPENLKVAAHLGRRQWRQVFISRGGSSLGIARSCSRFFLAHCSLYRVFPIVTLQNPKNFTLYFPTFHFAKIRRFNFVFSGFLLRASSRRMSKPPILAWRAPDPGS